MMQLNLPPFEIRLQGRGGKPYVWDILRMRYVRLTPEEWVRQHFVHYLVEHLSYPAELMMNEVSLHVGNLNRRADTILYNKALQPLILIEYKAPEVALSARVLGQAVRYNYTLRVPYLIISNGLEHQAYHIDYDVMSYTPLKSIPHYSDLQLK